MTSVIMFWRDRSVRGASYYKNMPLLGVWYIILAIRHILNAVMADAVLMTSPPFLEYNFHQVVSQQEIRHGRGWRILVALTTSL